MTQTSVSVVVVSRDRPTALLRCLAGLAQLQYDPFEIVVVADAKGCAAAVGSPWGTLIKIVPFERPNISEARNLGISHAAGEIVAFIDDDAVPEPSWLTQLVAPALRPHVAAMGGFVRGRNGISYQWKARALEETGATKAIEVTPNGATILMPKGALATKTEGTNMAVRRDTLVELEGFDPGFAFFLDETDLNLRLARKGYGTAIVPMAEVHHGFAASARRRADRVPRDLFDIGASWAVFQRKHMAQDDRADHWSAIRASERSRLLGHMVAGRLVPSNVRALMKRLDQGYNEGLTRRRGDAQVSNSPMAAFMPFPFVPRQSVVLLGRVWQASRLRAQAAERARAGDIVTLFLLSPTTLYHHVRFDSEGFWEQSGGLFGKSDRDDPPFRGWLFSGRVARERRRVAQQRLISG